MRQLFQSHRVHGLSVCECKIQGKPDLRMIKDRRLLSLSSQNKKTRRALGRNMNCMKFVRTRCSTQKSPEHYSYSLVLLPSGSRTVHYRSNPRGLGFDAPGTGSMRCMSLPRASALPEADLQLQT